MTDTVEKRFSADLRATLIQNERQNRKFDSENAPLDSIVARQQDAADFFDSIDPKPSSTVKCKRAVFVFR
jgi:hypothetical protein